MLAIIFTQLSKIESFIFRNVVNDNGEIKPRSLRFTWSMKTTSSRDPNEIMAEIKKVYTIHYFLALTKCFVYKCPIIL